MVNNTIASWLLYSPTSEDSRILHLYPAGGLPGGPSSAYKPKRHVKCIYNTYLSCSVCRVDRHQTRGVASEDDAGTDFGLRSLVLPEAHLSQKVAQSRMHRTTTKRGVRFTAVACSIEEGYSLVASFRDLVPRRTRQD